MYILFMTTGSWEYENYFSQTLAVGTDRVAIEALVDAANEVVGQRFDKIVEMEEAWVMSAVNGDSGAYEDNVWIQKRDELMSQFESEVAVALGFYVQMSSGDKPTFGIRDVKFLG